MVGYKDGSHPLSHTEQGGLIMNVDDLYLEGIQKAAEERQKRYVEALLSDSEEAVAKFREADKRWRKLVGEREELNKGQM